MNEEITIILRCEQGIGLNGTFQSTINKIRTALEPLDVIVKEGRICYDDLYQVRVYQKKWEEIRIWDKEQDGKA